MTKELQQFLYKHLLNLTNLKKSVLTEEEIRNFFNRDAMKSINLELKTSNLPTIIQEDIVDFYKVNKNLFDKTKNNGKPTESEIAEIMKTMNAQTDFNSEVILKFLNKFGIEAFPERYIEKALAKSFFFPYSLKKEDRDLQEYLIKNAKINFKKQISLRNFNGTILDSIYRAWGGHIDNKFENNMEFLLKYFKSIGIKELSGYLSHSSFYGEAKEYIGCVNVLHKYYPEDVYKIIDYKSKSFVQETIKNKYYQTIGNSLFEIDDNRYYGREKFRYKRLNFKLKQLPAKSSIVHGMIDELERQFTDSIDNNDLNFIKIQDGIIEALEYIFSIEGCNPDDYVIETGTSSSNGTEEIIASNFGLLDAYVSYVSYKYGKAKEKSRFNTNFVRWIEGNNLIIMGKYKQEINKLLQTDKIYQYLINKNFKLGYFQNVL